MTEDQDPILEAADALLAQGRKLESWSEGYPLWLVDGETPTDGDLLALAVRLGLMDSPGQTQ